MALGYNNKVLLVDLTTGEMKTEEPGDRFYRMYLGGAGLGTYYAMRDIPAHADPLGPDNRLIISTGVCTGAPVAATSRVVANFRSPVTGGIGCSEAGGAFGARMKYAGFDAIVFSGKAEKPVYLYVEGGKAELRDASHLWGLQNKEYNEVLKEELGAKACAFGIGPAGEKLNIYANISTGLTHFCGRTGAGAVMGSKNLKCIVAVGNKPVYEYADAEKLKAFDRQSIEKAKAGEYAWWQEQGTSGCPVGYNDQGVLVTKNYTEGFFEDADKIETNYWKTLGVYDGNHACLRCGIACKQRMKANKAQHGYDIDPSYGGPEYETAGAFGSNLLINDVVAIGKANELCNAYGADTISIGAIIAMLMECNEHGLLKKDQTYGVEIKWGSAEALLLLVEKCLKREGWLGDKMAQGLDACAEAVGGQEYAFSTKNNPPAMHAPQGRQNMAVNYGTHEYGDHQSIELDSHVIEGNFEGHPADFYQKGIYEALPYPAICEEKAKFNYYGHIQFTITNGLGVCDFGWNSGTAYDLADTVEIVKAVTGWNTNLWELMKSTERFIVLQRLFNQREGFGAKDDSLPERIFGKAYTAGSLKGSFIDKEDFMNCRSLYYDMAGMDEEGHPRHSKVIEMDLQWAEKLVKEAK